MASPISNVRVGVPVATFFCRFPMICPLVRETVPAEVMITLLLPALMLPDVSVNVPAMDISEESESEPDALFTVTLLNVPVEVSVCVPVPLKRIVEFVLVKVPPDMFQFPPIEWVEALEEGKNVPEERLKFPVMVNCVAFPPVKEPPL